MSASEGEAPAVRSMRKTVLGTVVDPDARTENKGPDRRLSLFFRVPESEIVTIKKQDRRIYYLLGNIYIRILDKDEPSQVVDAPPEAIASTSGTVTPRPMPSTSLTEKAAESRVAETHVPMETAQLTSDEELFQETGGSEYSDSCLRSSPSPN
ncbi:unnamed protein product [Pieris macdunnoughi]|uniref:Uncharacterized protein n=1 Tax=Pieris macdunnoughi TaxID=345717 RepID=A0A821X499_9NEOP|nr:unnamed protein product [Pieris macdunnoughi]